MAKPDVTMVAFHGTDKPASLERFLNGLTEEVGRIMDSYPRGIFESYTRYQIHATIIGMEADLLDREFYGHWFLENSSEKRKINIRRLWQVMQDIKGRNPLFTIRFGGFRKAYCECDPEVRKGWDCRSSPSEFHSCDRSAYEGSFYAFSPGPAIVTGWPVENVEKVNEFPRTLWNFRTSVEEGGFRDKYHGGKNPHWKDDDCFIRIGTFLRKLPERGLSTIEEAVREYLSAANPVTVDIKAEDVWIILYENTQLRQPHILERVAFHDFLRDPETVERLYERLKELRTS